MNTSKLSLVRMYISHSMICAPLWVRNFAEAFRCLYVSLPAFLIWLLLKGSQKTAVVSPECNFCRWMSLQWDMRCCTTDWITCGFRNIDLPNILPGKADQAEHIQNYFKQTKTKLDNGRKVVVTCFRNAFCVAASKTRPKLPFGWRTEIFD